MFKVGDKVRVKEGFIISSEDEVYYEGWLIEHNGVYDFGIVVDEKYVGRKTEWMFNNAYNEYYFVNEDSIQKFEDDKFKVGDRVKLMSDITPYVVDKGDLDNKIAIIKGIYDGVFQLDMSEFKFFVEGQYAFLDLDAFELVVDEPVVENEVDQVDMIDFNFFEEPVVDKFKVGDKVRFDKGVGVVVDMEDGRYLVHSKDIQDGHDGDTEDNNNNGWFRDRHLVLVEPKFKVGDKVKVVSLSINDDEYVPELGRYLGKVGTVYNIDDTTLNVEFTDNSWWFSDSNLEVVDVVDMTQEQLFEELGYYVEIV